jgi:hypothetical protein
MPTAHTPTKREHPAQTAPGECASVALSPDEISLVADLRASSKLRPILTDPKLGPELLAIALRGTFSELRAWLAERGVSISGSNVSEGRSRLRNAAKRINSRNVAMKAAREEAERSGTTLTKSTLEQFTVGVGDFLDGAADPETTEGRQLMLDGLAKITGAADLERKEKQGDAQIELKREDIAMNHRKIALLEKKAAAADAAKTLTKDTTLSPEEYRQRMREILGK